MIRIRIYLVFSVLLLLVGSCGRDDDGVMRPAGRNIPSETIPTGHPPDAFPASNCVIIDENFDDNGGGFENKGDGKMGKKWQPLPEGNWAFHSERRAGHSMTALVRGISYNLTDVLMFRFDVHMESGFGGPDNPILNIGFSDGDFATGDEDLPLAANSLIVSFTGARSRFGIGARDKFSNQISSDAPAYLIENRGTYRVEGTYDPSTGLYSCTLTSLDTNALLFDESIDLSQAAGFRGFDSLTHFGMLWPSFGGALSAIDGTWDNVLVEVSCAGALQLRTDIKPGSCPNAMNPKSQGKLPVAILGASDLDVHDINVSSLLLEGVAPIRSNVEDVSTPLEDGDECDCTEAGPDGYEDLTLKFKTQDIVGALGPLARGDVKMLTITGTLLDGTPFESSDCVVIVGEKAPHQLLLQGDPVHLGDTYNPEWATCAPSVPAAPYGKCYAVSFNLTQNQADFLKFLLVKSSGASAETSGKVYLDGVLLGYLQSAVLGGRCDFHEDYYLLPNQVRQAGLHEVKICTSVYNYKTGPELDDMAFYDLRLIAKKGDIPPVPMYEMSLEEIKSTNSK